MCGPGVGGGGATALLTTSCSLVGGDDDGGDDSKRVVLVTHESFVMSKELQKQFEDESGYDLVVKAVRRRRRAHQQAGAHQGRPDRRRGVRHRQHLRVAGDRRGRAGAVRREAAGRRRRLRARRATSRRGHDLTPVDTGNVCVNVDDTWFADKGIPEPQTLDDLAEAGVQGPVRHPRRDHELAGAGVPAGHDRGVRRTTGRTTGRELMANGAKLTQGWSDAYEVDFTQGGGGGDRPIVLSYDSSPAFTIDGQGGTTTSALLDTCFRQVEYAGVLAGAKNPRAPRRWSTSCSAGRSRRRCPTRCTSSRSTPAPTLPPRLGEVRRSSPTTPTPSTRPRSPSTATTGCASGATSPAR